MSVDRFQLAEEILSTLKAISGLVPVKMGSIRLQGEEITNLPAHGIVGKGIADVPEGRRIFGRLTVRKTWRWGPLEL